MSTAPDNSEHAHDDLTTAKGPPSDNPFASAANITISVPETVDIRLVDASALGDYEVWSLLTSIMSSVVIGFLVAAMQAPVTDPLNRVYKVIDGIAVLLMAICAITAYFKRRRLTGKVRRMKFRVGEPIPEDRQ